MGYFMFDKSGLVREEVVQPMKVQRLKCSIRGQVPHSPVFAARQRYVEDVVAPPSNILFAERLAYF